MYTHEQEPQPSTAKWDMTEDRWRGGITESDLKHQLDAFTEPCLLLRVDSPRFSVIGASNGFLQQSAMSAAEVTACVLVDVLADANTSNAIRLPHVELIASLNRVVRTGTIDVLAPRHFLLRTSGGRAPEIWWSVRTLPVHDADGTVAYLRLTFGDVTDTSTYPGRNDEVWIASDALALLEAVRTIGQQAALLREVEVKVEGGDPARLAYVKHIQQASVVLSERVDALLNVLSVSIGGIATERAPIDIVAVCRRAVLRVPGTRERCSVRVQCCEIPKPWANGRLIEQGLIHLLAHVTKHTDERGPVTAHVTRVETDRVRVTFEAQTPTVIGRELAREITRLRTDGGLAIQARSKRGLELCLAHLIFDAHGGDLWPEETSSGALRWHVALPVDRPRRVTASYSATVAMEAR